MVLHVSLTIGGTVVVHVSLTSGGTVVVHVSLTTVTYREKL